MDPDPQRKHILFLILIVLFFTGAFYQTDPNAVPADFGRSWDQLPLLPELSAGNLALLQEGLKAGHNPQAFSKVGDCDTSTTWYLSDFDLGERYYNLGDYKSAFEPVLAYYQGSFSRRSLAAKPGFSAASVLSSYWTDFTICDAGELPLACEYRLHNPLFVLVSLGTNDGYNPPAFRENLEAIVQATLAEKRLPILMTKADNVEGNFSINQDIADLAKEYDLPVWNFWASIQNLPSRGLVEDGIHLTFYKNDFSDPIAYQYAWTFRNLTALQILEMMMKATQALQP